MSRYRKAAIAIFSGLLVLSCAVLLFRSADYKRGEETYRESAELIELPDFSVIDSEPVPIPIASPDDGDEVEVTPAEEAIVYVDPYAEALLNMDFTALRDVNSDILGWIVIPETGLSYPLLQGEDNEYYLNRTWKKRRNSQGAIFMDYRCDPGLGDFHTIIYGHRMNNNSMFGYLLKYRDPDYLNRYPSVYIFDDNGSHRYDIFAVYEASVTEGSTYMLSFTDDSQKQEYIDHCISHSAIAADVVPLPSEKILTLSTCTGHGHATRWVVQAVLREVISPPVEESGYDISGKME